MSRELTLTKQGLLMWRVGDLKFGDQSCWSRAPRKKGMWAFPHPYFEPSFVYHQYYYHAPKELKDYPNLDLPYGTTFEYRDKALKDVPVEPTQITLNKDWDDPNESRYMGPLGACTFSYPKDFADRQNEWLKVKGQKFTKPHKFFWDGNIYCHFRKDGTLLGFNEWDMMSVQDLSRVIKKMRGDVGFKFILGGQPQRMSRELRDVRYTHDCFEVFLTPEIGRMRG